MSAPFWPLNDDGSICAPEGSGKRWPGGPPHCQKVDLRTGATPDVPCQHEPPCPTAQEEREEWEIDQLADSTSSHVAPPGCTHCEEGGQLGLL